MRLMTLNVPTFLEGPPPLHNSYKSPNSSSVKQPLNNKRPATLYNGHFKQLQLYTSDLLLDIFLSTFLTRLSTIAAGFND